MRKKPKMQKSKMIDGIDNLIDMSLRLNKSTPILQTIQQTPVQKLTDRQSYYILTRSKPQSVYVFRNLYAVDFHSLT